MLDMEALVCHLMSQGEKETNNIEEMKNLFNILVNQCDTEEELNAHLQNGSITEEKLLFMLDNIEDMFEMKDDFSRLASSIFMGLYRAGNVPQKKKRLL